MSNVIFGQEIVPHKQMPILIEIALNAIDENEKRIFWISKKIVEIKEGYWTKEKITIQEVLIERMKYFHEMNLSLQHYIKKRVIKNAKNNRHHKRNN